MLKNGWLASASCDSTIKLWDLKAREEVKTLSGHAGSVASLQLLNNGHLASYSLDDTIKIWNPYKDGINPILTMKGHRNKEWIFNMAIMANGNLVTTSGDKEECVLSIWNPTEGKLVKTIPTGSTEVCSILEVSDEQVVFSFGQGSIKLMNSNDETKFRQKKAHVGRIYSLRLLSNRFLVSAGWDEFPSIKVWNLDDLTLVQSIQTDHSNAIRSIEISSNEKLLATVSDDKTIKLWPICFNF